MPAHIGDAGPASERVKHMVQIKGGARFSIPANRPAISGRLTFSKVKFGIQRRYNTPDMVVIAPNLPPPRALQLRTPASSS